MSLDNVVELSIIKSEYCFSRMEYLFLAAVCRAGETTSGARKVASGGESILITS